MARLRSLSKEHDALFPLYLDPRSGQGNSDAGLIALGGAMAIPPLASPGDGGFAVSIVIRTELAGLPGSSKVI
jgi:hypothetical protein